MLGVFTVTGGMMAIQVLALFLAPVILLLADLPNSIRRRHERKAWRMWWYGATKEERDKGCAMWWAIHGKPDYKPLDIY